MSPASQDEKRRSRRRPLRTLRRSRPRRSRPRGSRPPRRRRAPRRPDRGGGGVAEPTGTEAEAAGEAQKADEAAKPKPARRRAAASAEVAASAEEEAQPARSASRTTSRTAKAPAKRAKAAAASTEVKVDLPPSIFEANVNLPLIHQVVVAQQAAARQGTHATKTRGEVRGGGRKPYRQKGTGRARQGSVRAPQFAGGGVVHGPVPRSYAQKTPKKMKAAALRGALSDRARHGLVQVVGGFVDGESPKTADAVAVLAAVTGAAPARRGFWSSPTARTRSPGRACATPPACT